MKYVDPLIVICAFLPNTKKTKTKHQILLRMPVPYFGQKWQLKMLRCRLYM